ncbi:HD domain-containing protein [Vibrio sp. Of7-15]|uniref:HD domain-containing protein n=1 Tax=Vibrio sp. Of7-15 TaxID=2724879 RepID=UPI001EF27CFB|nr:HD domain-containing protein [Vibrio sp. Of7-15]MCG7496462.1 HD domain-containing protein [Vibrio sp. Of7-15]
MNNRYLKAQTFARERHKNQNYGDLPYYRHLDEVAEIASPFGNLAMIVAQLHDVLEDTDTTVDEIAHEFGFTVANAVFFVTDCEHDNRLIRKKNMNKNLACLNVEDDAGRLALLVKSCDRLANLRASKRISSYHFERYQKEHADFRAAVYRPGLCEAIWWEIEQLVKATVER